MSADRPPIYLIDASGFIYRAYFSRPPLAATDGLPANAVLGYIEMIAHLMKYAQNARIGVVFDTKAKTWRHRLHKEYKANRPEKPRELASQFIPIQQATDALGLSRIECDGFEADDLMATYAVEANARGHDCVIVSGDKDMMQMVNDHGVIAQFDPLKQRMINEAGVVAKWGVPPSKLIDVMGLAGDATDNVPGVPMIGEKIAAELVKRYGSLEDVIDNWGEVGKARGKSLWENREAAALSKQLVTLSTDAPMPVPFENLCSYKPDQKALRRFLDWLGPNYTPAAMKVYL